MTRGLNVKKCEKHMKKCFKIICYTKQKLVNKMLIGYARVRNIDINQSCNIRPPDNNNNNIHFICTKYNFSYIYKF